MKVIRPITLTDAMLIASDIPEPDSGEAIWNSGTTYGAGADVYIAATHAKYRSKQAGNLNHDPTTDAARTWWYPIGGTNRWACFDQYLSTASSRAATSLAVTIAPGVVDALFLYGLVGTTATVVMTNGAGGPTVYSETLNLLEPKINDWYAYYFEPNRQVPFFVLTDLPPYLNGRITITVTGDSPVSMGMVKPGRSYTVGSTLASPRAGILDYSKKDTDPDSGFTILTQGRFKKTSLCQVRTANNVINEVHQTLEDLRATACVWIGDDTGDNQPFTLYGFYKDMYVTMDLPSAGLYNLELEGMV